MAALISINGLVSKNWKLLYSKFDTVALISLLTLWGFHIVRQKSIRNFKFVHALPILYNYLFGLKSESGEISVSECLQFLAYPVPYSSVVIFGNTWLVYIAYKLQN